MPLHLSKRLKDVSRNTQKKIQEQETIYLSDSIPLTTETTPNLKITKRIEIVTSDWAIGVSIFKYLFAGVRNFVGGCSEAMQKTMRDSLKMAL